MVGIAKLLVEYESNSTPLIELKNYLLTEFKKKASIAITHEKLLQRQKTKERRRKPMKFYHIKSFKEV